MKSILDFLRKPASSSADLREKLVEIETALPTAEAEAARLTAERAGRLLEASDRELETIERQISDARRTVDRLRAAKEEVSRRLDAAIVEEAARALTNEKDATERRAKAVADRLRKELPGIVSSLSALVADLETAEAGVEAVNGRLIASGRAGERLEPVENRVLPLLPSPAPEAYSLRAISLPPIPHLNFAGLGALKRRADMDGVGVMPEAAE